jgi:hypothetical protein
MSPVQHVLEANFLIQASNLSRSSHGLLSLLYNNTHTIASLVTLWFYLIAVYSVIHEVSDSLAHPAGVTSCYDDCAAS